MTEIIHRTKVFFFQLRWLFMSQEERYVYLWNRTKSMRKVFRT